MNTDKRVEIGVEISWALVCGAIAVLFWGYAGHVILTNCFDLHWGFYAGLILVLVINAVHFCFGLLHIHDDVSDLNPGTSVWMQNAYQGDYVGMRIISILTIGLSSYLQSAIRSYRGK